MSNYRAKSPTSIHEVEVEVDLWSETLPFSFPQPQTKSNVTYFKFQVSYIKVIVIPIYQIKRKNWNIWH